MLPVALCIGEWSGTSGTCACRPPAVPVQTLLALLLLPCPSPPRPPPVLSRLENTLNYGMERVWALGVLKGSNSVAIGFDEGVAVIKIGGWGGGGGGVGGARGRRAGGGCARRLTDRRCWLERLHANMSV
jgi:hypothetical protein